MKLMIIYILIVGMSLTGMSYVYQLAPIVYTTEDTQFARGYASDMLLVLEAMQHRSVQLADTTKPTACDFFLDGQDRFYQEKHGAVHYKQAMAEDFVYAFALAEDWCRFASRAACDRQDDQSRQLADERYRKARREFQVIMNKDYAQFNAKNQ